MDREDTHDSEHELDYSGWSHEDFVGEIKKLRRENASKRVRLRELSEKSADSTLNITVNERDELRDKLQKLRDRIETGEYVSSSSLELLKSAFLREKGEADSALALAREELTKERLLRDAYTKVYNSGYKFKNVQEQTGFEYFVLNKGKNGAFKSPEEISSSIDVFLKENFTPAQLPVAGPLPGSGSPASEILRIMKKGKLASEDIKRICELEAQIERLK